MNRLVHLNSALIHKWSKFIGRPEHIPSKCCGVLWYTTMW